MRASFGRPPSFTILALALFALGCGDDDDPVSPQPPSANLTGTWQFVVDITVETGICTGNNEPTWQATVDIVQAENDVTATSDWNSVPGTGPHEFGGTLSGNQLVLDGSYPEGTGTTLALYELTVSENGNSMSGTETWTYVGDEGTCSDSMSEITATRIAPD
jgi:hypothetical protein